MKVCFLISGIVRSYYNNLHNFFIQLSKTPFDFDVYINFLKEDDLHYHNTMEKKLDRYRFYKSILYSENVHNSKTQKENNSLNQWYRLYELFKLTPNNYDLYIRIRPDIKILLDINEFLLLVNNIDINKISIPNGYDFHNGYELANEKNICINDQIAIANYNNMKIYIEFYN